MVEGLGFWVSETTDGCPSHGIVLSKPRPSIPCLRSCPSTRFPSILLTRLARPAGDAASDSSVYVNIDVQAGAVEASRCFASIPSFHGGEPITGKYNAYIPA